MKVMATMTFDPARRSEMLAHIPAEQARVRELQAQGTLDVLHVAQARDRAWLVLNVETEVEAHDVLASLPLHTYATIDVAALAGPR